MDFREDSDWITEEMLEDFTIDDAFEVRARVWEVVLFNVELVIAELVRLSGQLVPHPLHVLAATAEEVRQLQRISAEALEQHREEIRVRADFENSPIAVGHEFERGEPAQSP